MLKIQNYNQKFHPLRLHRAYKGRIADLEVLLKNIAVPGLPQTNVV